MVKASNKEQLAQSMLMVPSIETQSSHCIGSWTFRVLNKAPEEHAYGGCEDDACLPGSIHDAQAPAQEALQAWPTTHNNAYAKKQPQVHCNTHPACGAQPPNGNSTSFVSYDRNSLYGA